MSATRTTRIEISKEYLHFSAAHFTIFSRTEREDLHGHNFYVTAEVVADVGDDGLAFDYNLLKRAIGAICQSLDEKVLLPERSPYLELERDGAYLYALFADERIPFLPRDVLTLPVRNISVEELAPWVLEQLWSQPEILAQNLHYLRVRVSSGPGQWAGAERQRESQ